MLRYSLWKKHDALPEVFDTRAESPTAARDSPLRPELIEAIFYLSLALPGDAMVFEMVGHAGYFEKHLEEVMV